MLAARASWTHEAQWLALGAGLLAGLVYARHPGWSYGTVLDALAREFAPERVRTYAGDVRDPESLAHAAAAEAWGVEPLEDQANAGTVMMAVPRSGSIEASPVMTAQKIGAGMPVAVKATAATTAFKAPTTSTPPMTAR